MVLIGGTIVIISFLLFFGQGEPLSDIERQCRDRCQVCTGRPGVDLMCEVDPECVEFCLNNIER